MSSGFEPSRRPSCERRRPYYLESESPTWSTEMEEHEPHVFANADIEILPPEHDDEGCLKSTCACCGRLSALDEDCYGICEECLSP
jgi:hypothetical protein